MDWYLKVLRQYADFDGRARRQEYWMYTLFNILIIGVLYVLMFMGGADGGAITMIAMGLVAIYSLAVMIPSVAVAVRRLHDVGKSGWMLLIGLVPILGGIWLLVLYCTDSQPGDNEYGPNPKEDII
jgi:uncharacterized membrane protein YhaH (DUF805 family)